MSTANPLPLDAAARDELARKASDAAASIGDLPWGWNVRAAWLPDAEKAFVAAATPDVILALLASVRGAEADTARLDWLEAHRTAYLAPEDFEDGSPVIVGEWHGVNDRQYTDLGVGFTVREAIDAARAHPPTKETDADA